MFNVAVVFFLNYYVQYTYLVQNTVASSISLVIDTRSHQFVTRDIYFHMVLIQLETLSMIKHLAPKKTAFRKFLKLVQAYSMRRIYFIKSRHIILSEVI